MTVAPGDYLEDTRPRRLDSCSNRYHSDVPEAWKVFYAFGGITMGAALRAIDVHLDRPDFQPVSASAIFCAPVECGPIEIGVEVLRDGRTASQAVATLAPVGSSQPALRMQATFGVRHDSDLSFDALEFPEVPGPLACDPPPPEGFDEDDFPKLNFHDQTDWRPALPLRAWEPEVRRATAGVAEFASWTRLVTSPRHEDGTYEWSALCVPGDQLGSAVGRKLGSDGPGRAFFVLTLEIAMRFVRRPQTDWVLQHSHGWISKDGYATGDVVLWDEARRCCAIATQTANLRALKPEQMRG